MYYGENALVQTFNNVPLSSITSWIDQSQDITMLDIQMEFWYNSGSFISNNDSWIVTQCKIVYRYGSEGRKYYATYAYASDALFRSGKSWVRKQIVPYLNMTGAQEFRSFGKSIYYQGGNGSQTTVGLVVFSLPEEGLENVKWPDLTPDSSTSALKWSISSLFIPIIVPIALVKSIKATRTHRDGQSTAALVITSIMSACFASRLLSSVISGITDAVSNLH